MSIALKEGGEGSDPSDICEKGEFDSENSKCKGPGARKAPGGLEEQQSC